MVEILDAGLGGVLRPKDKAAAAQGRMVKSQYFDGFHRQKMVENDPEGLRKHPIMVRKSANGEKSKIAKSRPENG